jgi:hypothetical protein
VAADAIYNFVLNQGHLLQINGVTTCTLAHEFTEAVVAHPYFGKRVEGKRNVMDDLVVSAGFDEGYIEWRNVIVHRDPVTGFIDMMRPSLVAPS